MILFPSMTTEVSASKNRSELVARLSNFAVYDSKNRNRQALPQEVGTFLRNNCKIGFIQDKKITTIVGVSDEVDPDEIKLGGKTRSYPKDNGVYYDLCGELGDLRYRVNGYEIVITHTNT